MNSEANRKPMSYGSLTTVIEFMDPNLRFLLSSRVPAIRSIEKNVPLRIDKLVFDDHRIEVNDTTYECEIHQMDCSTSKVPYQVSGINELNGRRTCDVDAFGVPDHITKAGGMLPGNDGVYEKNLFGDYDRQTLLTNEKRFEKLEQRLEVQKKRRDQLLSFRPRSTRNFDSRKSQKTIDRAQERYFRFETNRTQDQDRIFTVNELKLLKNKENQDLAIEYANKRIDLMEKELLPFKNKNDDTRPKFEIRVIKYKGYSSTILERVQYTGDLHKAVISLREFMFSKRRHAVAVKDLYIPQSCSIPMPRDLKMRITSLALEKTVPTELVEPIIDTSLPLKELYIRINHHAEQNLDHEFIGSSKLLKLNLVPDHMIPSISNLVNQTVEIGLALPFLTDEQFVCLIRNWMVTGKPVGTSFTFRTGLIDEMAISLFDAVCDEIEEATANNGVLFIPIKNEAVLKISWNEENDVINIRMVVESLD
uniref:Major sperm protein n=1 Tax=Caenorhabditis tropicalis TaxID=1561998 RepID=A0A1I7TMV7_9PELO